jgi:phosphoenolpyruvate carboxylase
MIDYERKQGGCAPLWDWLHKCSSCLKEKVIGRDFHVTPRVPNVDRDRDDPYFWQGIGILVNSLLVMSRVGFEGQGFSEFIIPDATDGETIAKIECDIFDRYDLQRKQYQRHGDGSSFPFKGDFFVQGIPLIESVEDLLHPEPIWDVLIGRRREWSKRETYVQRSFIARSDPALKAGMIPALIAANVALDRGRKYEAEIGVRIPQIVGIGSAPFRGGLIPDKKVMGTILAAYPGMATVTLQSAFRYDYPETQVIKANTFLEETIKQNWLERQQIMSINEEELEALRQIVATFKKAYETSYKKILPLMTQVASWIPNHRERYKNVEVAGEDRQVGGMPAVRAIKFAASCYTLGFPPGLLGLRAWEKLDEDQKVLAERTCPTIRFWVGQEAQWFNPDNLESTKRLSGLRPLLEDIEMAKYLTQDEEINSKHAEVTSRVPRALKRGEDIGPLFLKPLQSDDSWARNILADAMNAFKSP